MWCALSAGRKRSAGPIIAAAVVGLVSAAAGMGAPPDVSGTWAMVQVTTDIVNYPLAGHRIRESYLLLILEIEQTGTDLIVHETHCLAHMDDGTPLVKTEIPDAFLRSLGTVTRTAELHQVDGGWRLDFPWGVEVHGALLENAGDEPLPTEASDPRVIDQDGDGNPGVTVRVTILGALRGEVYAVQRLRKNLKGTMVSADRIEGTITWSNEQVVLGATSALLMTGGDATVHPDPWRSYFIAQRIDDRTACSDLDAVWWSLFGL